MRRGRQLGLWTPSSELGRWTCPSLFLILFLGSRVPSTFSSSPGVLKGHLSMALPYNLLSSSSSGCILLSKVFHLFVTCLLSSLSQRVNPLGQGPHVLSPCHSLSEPSTQRCSVQTCWGKDEAEFPLVQQLERASGLVAAQPCTPPLIPTSCQLACCF